MNKVFFFRHSHKEASESSVIINGKAFEKLEQDVLAELELLDEYVSRAAELVILIRLLVY